MKKKFDDRCGYRTEKNFVNTYVQDLDLSCKKVVYQQQQQKNKLKTGRATSLAQGSLFALIQVL